MGLMIHNTILSYYIEDYQYNNELHLVILKAFSVICGMAIFCFSVYERQELLRIFTSLTEQGYDLSQYEFITSVPIINLQKNNFESVAEAVFSTNPEVRIVGDPFFRNIKIIDKLFTTGRIKEIGIHNCTCLLNESIILQRWMKNYCLAKVLSL
ncbi:MAG: hypothetical protein ACFFCC_18380 [Promethearchaeota archaeon]